MTNEVKKRKKPSKPQRMLTRIINTLGQECASCGLKENPTLDHIVPLSKGGFDDDGNAQLLCKPCNEIKGSALLPAGYPIRVMVKGRRVRNPNLAGIKGTALARGTMKCEGCRHAKVHHTYVNKFYRTNCGWPDGCDCTLFR